MEGELDTEPSPAAPRRSALPPLHRAKLRPPAAGDHYVRRPRLHALLDDSVGGPVTLVIAPAGAGKTSLVAGWTAEAVTAVAWLSCDETDRDAVQLWSGL